MITVLGIDPGTRRIGYGVVTAGPKGPSLGPAGLLPIRGRNDAEVLRGITEEVAALIRATDPSLVVLERLFFSKNQKTAMRVAEARGAILATIASCGAPVWEITPNELKSMIAGDGHADKKAILKMVRLELREPGLVVIDDVSDALALALAGLHRTRLDKRGL